MSAEPIWDLGSINRSIGDRVASSERISIQEQDLREAGVQSGTIDVSVKLETASMPTY